uniref:Uncharacterized protein n=1 Tax=Fagus sylvatica TaxID=28930 RepID=A0A2N9GTU9_FAGSY
MFRFLFPCVCCVEGVATTCSGCLFLGLRPFLIGESAVDYFSSAVREELAATSVHVAFRLPFCLWLRLFLIGESAVCSSSAVRTM